MNIQAIWENGVFRPLLPITIKHTKLTIVVPDEEIATSESEKLPVYNLNDFPVNVREAVLKMQTMRDEVLNASVINELAEETEEQKQRWRAFELRRSLRFEQGRAV
jgi:predicted DNA-binding antitoxin AbrB/MazE fold protein